MKIQIDTIKKRFTLEEAVNLGELIEWFEKLFPGGDWKEFTLESQVITNWNNPIVIKETYPVWPYPNYPWYPWTTYGGLSTGSRVEEIPSDNFISDNGIYNVEIKSIGE